MIVPTRHEFPLYEGGRLVEVWLVVDDDLWYVHCMDCGTRIGTVNAGNESGALRLDAKHQDVLHM